jgi:hypothetical protein
MIHDEFSCRTDVSRARRYQLRHQRDGICIYCAEPRVTKFHCVKHAAVIRERMRKRLGCVRRNVGAGPAMAAAWHKTLEKGRRHEAGPCGIDISVDVGSAGKPKPRRLRAMSKTRVR